MRAVARLSGTRARPHRARNPRLSSPHAGRATLPRCARDARLCRAARGTRDSAALRAGRATLPRCARDARLCRDPLA